jgi:hypothetical protein
MLHDAGAKGLLERLSAPLRVEDERLRRVLPRASVVLLSECEGEEEERNKTEDKPSGAVVASTSAQTSASDAFTDSASASPSLPTTTTTASSSPPLLTSDPSAPLYITREAAPAHADDGALRLFQEDAAEVDCSQLASVAAEPGQVFAVLHLPEGTDAVSLAIEGSVLSVTPCVRDAGPTLEVIDDADFAETLVPESRAYVSIGNEVLDVGAVGAPVSPIPASEECPCISGAGQWQVEAVTILAAMRCGGCRCCAGASSTTSSAAASTTMTADSGGADADEEEEDFEALLADALNSVYAEDDASVPAPPEPLATWASLPPRVLDILAPASVAAAAPPASTDLSLSSATGPTTCPRECTAQCFLQSLRNTGALPACALGGECCCGRAIEALAVRWRDNYATAHSRVHHNNNNINTPPHPHPHGPRDAVLGWATQPPAVAVACGAPRARHGRPLRGAGERIRQWLRPVSVFSHACAGTSIGYAVRRRCGDPAAAAETGSIHLHPRRVPGRRVDTSETLARCRYRNQHLPRAFTAAVHQAVSDHPAAAARETVVTFTVAVTVTTASLPPAAAACACAATPCASG